MSCLVLRSCLEQSTAHGLVHVASGRTYLQRVIWIIVLLSSTGAFSYYFSRNLSKYYAQPVSVQLNSRGSTFVPPDLHICNIRPFSYSRLLNSEKSNSSEIKSLVNYLTKLENDFKKEEPNKPNLMSSVFFWTSMERHKLYSAFGPLLNQTVVSSLFLNNGNELEFEETSHFEFFSCFRLSLNKTKSDMTTTDSLELTLFVDTYQTKKQGLSFNDYPLDAMYYPVYIRDALGQDGVRLVFTPPGGYPDVDSHSVLVRPGGHTTIKLCMQQHVLQSTTRQPCIEKEQTVEYVNVILGGNKTTTYGKSYTTCKYERMLAVLMDLFPTCQCIPYTTPVEVDVYQNYSLCLEESDSDENISCVILYDTLSSIIDFNDCMAEEPCSSLSYTSKTLRSDWPVDHIQHQFIQNILVGKIQEQGGDAMPPGLANYVREINANTAVGDAMTRASFARVTISPGETRSMQIVESIAYEMENLISDTGGLAGLYLGMSFLTILEVMNLIHDIIYNQIKSKKKETCDEEDGPATTV